MKSFMSFSVDTFSLQKTMSVLLNSTKNNPTDGNKVLIESIGEGKALLLTNNGSIATAVILDNVFISENFKEVFDYSALSGFVLSVPVWDGETGSKGFELYDDDNYCTIKTTIYHEGGKYTENSIKLIKQKSNSVHYVEFFEKPTFVVDKNVFSAAVKKVIYAVNRSDVRQFIQGVCLSFSDGYINLAGTNGKVLSEYKIKSDVSFEGRYIIKYDFISNIRKILGSSVDETNANFYIDDRYIAVNVGNVYFFGNKVIGFEYPEYEGEFDKYEHEIVIDKSIIYSGISPFKSVLDSEDYNRVSINFNSNGLNIYNDMFEFNYEGGDDFTFDGDVTVDVDGVFLRSTIDEINDELVVVRFSSANGNLIFDSLNHKNQKSLITHIKRRN